MTASPPLDGDAPLGDLHRMLRMLNAGQDLTQVLEAAATGVEMLGFGVVAINLLTDGDAFEVVTVRGPAESLRGTRNDRQSFLDELAAADEWGLLRFVPAGRWESADGYYWRPSRPPVDGEDAWQADDGLYAPLHGPDGALLGILSVDLPADGRRPPPRIRQLLEIYAVQIGLAVGATREADRLRERLRLSEATRAVVERAASPQPLPEVLAACVEPLTAGFRTDRAWIRLLADPDGAWGDVDFPHGMDHALRTAAGHDERGFPPLDVDRVLATTARLAGECWREQRTLVVSELGSDSSEGMLTPRSRSRILTWLAGAARGSLVLVPLGAGPTCLGYVVLSRSLEVGVWSPAEDEAALATGRELGRVIGNARARELEAAVRRRLEELDAHKNRVFTTVVHELKNPLAVITGNLELVAEDPTVIPRAHAAIAASADRMLGLVQDMLTLTHLRRTDTTAELTRVDLGAVVREAAATMAATAATAGVRLRLDDVRPGVAVTAEADQVERLVVNLLSNAVKFTDAGGEVRLAVGVEDDHAVLVVTDTGIGIATADLEPVFEDFRRASDGTARRRPGNGLGLPIARRIAERHGGRLTVESEPGEGSTFTARLLRDREHDRRAG